MPKLRSTTLSTIFKTVKITVSCSTLFFYLVANNSYAQSNKSQPTTSVSTTVSTVDSKKTEAQRTYNLPKVMLTKLMQNMVLVEAGSFNMGSDSPQARAREKPVHKVTLNSFYISKFELTQDIFTQIMGWNDSYFPCENCAVNNISWFNMQLFIERLNIATGKNFSLPTEKQWAYAARGGNKSKNYKYSGSNNIDDVAWFDKNSNNKSHPVGLKKANELGIFDMTGNLWEFCLDDMNRHAYKTLPNYLPPKENIKTKNVNSKRKAMKVIRGGGYEFSAIENLVFMRDGATNNVRMADIGFRLVLDKK